MDWLLITDLVDGRREIIGWARKGLILDWRGLERDEWLVLCLQRKTEGATACIECRERGWLPETADDLRISDVTLMDQILHDSVRLRKLVTQDILKAAERYRSARE